MNWRNWFGKAKQVVHKAVAQKGEIIYLKDPLDEVMDAQSQ